VIVLLEEKYGMNIISCKAISVPTV